MGYTSASHTEYESRASIRGSSARAAFTHDYDIKAGAKKAEVHPSLNPKGAFRESRDSDAHPVTLPIAVFCDTTGSMGKAPKIIQKSLSKLMGTFVDDKLSGKKYLGEAFPAILIGAIDDFNAQRMYGGEGALQVGQFESGLEIDDNLGNLWLTHNGGGTYEESYELALWFMAHRTAHDAMDKRRKKGYLFLIGDEHAYGRVEPEQIEKLIGVGMQTQDLSEVIAEAQKLYHVFFIIPKLSQHFEDASLARYWGQLLGQQNLIKLEDPEKICECIAGAVALKEGFIGLDDLERDGVDSKALVHVGAGAVAKTEGKGALVKGGKTKRL